ncbi:hypothetical protein MKL26_04610 [Streptococcus suis]|nr:hypothetical protein [Streptococcus suis]
MKKVITILLVVFTAFMFVACSKSPKDMTFKEYIKTTDFSDFEYDSEHDVYIVSQDLNTAISNENAIENFNDSIYDVVKSGVAIDKDVVFRGWDGSLPGALIYYKSSTFTNIAKSSTAYNSVEIYKKSDGWQVTSKFGQYLSENDYANTSSTEEMLFELAMYSK